MINLKLYLLHARNFYNVSSVANDTFFSQGVFIYICTCISPNKHNCKRKFIRFLKNGMKQSFLTGKGMQMATEQGVLWKMESLAHEQNLVLYFVIYYVYVPVKIVHIQLK